MNFSDFPSARFWPGRTAHGETMSGLLPSVPRAKLRCYQPLNTVLELDTLFDTRTEMPLKSFPNRTLHGALARMSWYLYDLGHLTMSSISNSCVTLLPCVRLTDELIRMYMLTPAFHPSSLNLTIVPGLEDTACVNSVLTPVILMTNAY